MIKFYYHTYGFLVGTEKCKDYELMADVYSFFSLWFDLFEFFFSSDEESLLCFFRPESSFFINSSY